LPNTVAPPAALHRRPIRRVVLAWTVAAPLLAAAVGLVVYLLTPSAVDQRLTDLKAGDAAKSQPALEWLAETDPLDSQRAKVTAALETPLFDGDPHGNLDPDLLLRTYLAWAGKDNVPAMIRMVQNATLPSWSSAKTGLVMQALGKMQDERAAEALAEKLSDPVLDTQAVNALELLGPKAENAVIGCVFDGDPDTRLRATRLLAEYGVQPQAMAAEALNRLQSSQADVRRAALVWFVDNPPADETQRAVAALPLAAILDDSSPEGRRQALEAMKLWATRDSLPELLAYAQREQKDLSGDPLLIDVLAQFPDERAAEGLALQLPNANERDNAAKALLSLGPVAVEAILPYINHPNADVRQAALDLCRRLNVPDDRLLEQTLADVADARVQRSVTALRRLASLRPDEASRAKVSDALNAPLLDPHGDVRAAALNVVKVWGSQDNTTTLLSVLGSVQPDGPERDASVIDLLGSLKDPKAASALAQGLTHRGERGAVGQALISIGPEAESAVIPFLQSVDTGARIEACQVLAEIGGVASLQPLQEAVYNLPPGQPGYVLLREAQVAMQKIAART
jgi:hypothetical protein